MSSTFSDKTFAALARSLAHEIYSHSEFDLLFVEHGVEQFNTGGNLQVRALRLLTGIREKYGVEKADQIFVELIEQFLNRFQPQRLENSDSIQRLLAALQADEFEYQGDRLVPTTPGPVSLAPQISALEMALDHRGFQTALTHFRQATDNFSDGNWEACNGQIRSYLEDLFLRLCEAQTGKYFRDPSGALQHLRDVEKLDPQEWNISRSLWNAIQTNGPHSGLSYQEEARFRLHQSTALGRYLMDKFFERMDVGEPPAKI